MSTFTAHAPPRIAVVTCLWGRPNITRPTLRYYARARSALADQVELIGIAAGSEGRRSRLLARNAGFHYLEVPNRPLSQKWNAAAKEARSHDVDAVLIIGSDDWVSHPLLLRYAEILAEGRHDYVGLLDQFFVQVGTRKCKRFRPYEDPKRKGEPVGVGRLLRRDLLERLAWTPWPDGLNSSLDAGMTRRLSATRPRDPLIRTMAHMGAGCIALDVKSATNICSFGSFKNTASCHLWTASKHFSRNDRLLLARALS